MTGRSSRAAILLLTILASASFTALGGDPLSSPEGAAPAGDARATKELAPRPDLVAYLPSFSPTEQQRRDGAVVLWNDETVEAGKETEKDRLRVHFAVLILSEQAVVDYGEFALAFHSYFDDLVVEMARVVFPDGSVKQLAPDAVQDKTTSDALQFNEVRLRTFALPRPTVGSAVEVRYSFETKIPAIPNHWTRALTFHYAHFRSASTKPRIDAVLSSRLTIRSSHGRPLRYAVTRTDLKPTLTRDAGVDQYLWEASDLAPVPVEDRMSPVWDRIPTIVAGSIENWKQVDAWAASFLDPASKPTPEIEELARTLTADKRTRVEKIQAVFYYLQDHVRYIEADVLRGGLTPHPSQESLRNGYGDCKDQAVLLVSLLRASGIEAHVALLNVLGQRDIAQGVPTPFAFRHAIVRVSGDEPPLWLDSSPSSGECGRLDWSFQDRWAFVVDGKGGRFERTPEDPAESNRGYVLVTLAYENAELVGTMAVKATGALGHRLKSRLGPDPDRDRFMELALKANYPLARILTTEYKDLQDARQPFEATCRFRLTSEGSAQRPPPRYAGSVWPILVVFTGMPTLPEPGSRKTDFMIGPPCRLIAETLCPSPFSRFHPIVPAPADAVETEEIAFRRDYEWQDNAIKVKLDLAFKQPIIPLEKYEAFHAAMQKAIERSSWMVGFDSRPEDSTKAASLDQVLLKERTYRNLRIPLPDWSVEAEKLDSLLGRVVLTSPDIEGKAVLGWSSGDLPDQDTMKLVLELSAGGSKLEDAGEMLVDGRHGSVLSQNLAGRHAIWTTWTCPGDRTFLLGVVAARPQEELAAFSRRILAGAACGDAPADDAKPILPVFEPPKGYEKTAMEDGIYFQDGESSGFIFPRGLPGREVFDAIPTNPALIEGLLKGLQFDETKIESGPVSSDGRLVWNVAVREGAEVVARLVIVCWYCPESNVTFLGIHVGTPDRDKNEVVTKLLTARCPKAVSSSPARPSPEP